MTLLSIIIALIIVGAILYLVNSVLPIDATVKKVINIVVIIVVCLWLIVGLFGAGGMLGGVTMPRIR